MTNRHLVPLLLCVLLVGCGTSVTDQPVETALPFSKSQLQRRSDNEPTSFVVVEPDEVTKTTYEATIVDTRQFENQIWRSEPFKGDIRDVEGMRGGEADAPEINKVAPNSLSINGAIGRLNRIHPLQSFPGIQDSGF